MRAGVEIVATGLGAVTPVGLSAASTCAALRAGIARLKAIETMPVEGEGVGGVAAIGGRVPTEWFHGGPAVWEWPGHERFEKSPPPPPESLVAPGSERLVEITRPAVREAWRQAALDRMAPQRVGLYLGLEEGEPAQPVFQAVATEIRRTPEPLSAHTRGRAAGLLALAAAARDLGEGRVGAALVGGVDSLIRAPALDRLQRARRLRTQVRPGGIIPGEAAAFLFLESTPSARRRSALPLARLLSTGIAEEPTAGSKEPNQAVGLTHALREAIDDGGGLETLPFTVCDLNGDRYRATEWGMASIRVVGHIEGDLLLHHPADCIGDPGAASGPLDLLWAAVALASGYAGCARALVWGASDGADRAAALLAAPMPRKEA